MTASSDTTKIELIRGKKVLLEIVTKRENPIVEAADTTGVVDFSNLHLKPVGACIYCGSTVGCLSDEHVLASALSGSTTIPKGSCETCRKITEGFETAVLRGPMRMVRYVQSMRSRTKYKDLPVTIPVKINVDGHETTIDAPRDEAPILLPFPILEPGLRLTEIATGSFGADPKEFGKRHGAQQVELEVTNNDVIAFVRMLTKTAYTAAFAYDQLRRLKNPGDLVRAMMYEPNTLGNFVVTAPGPYKQYGGLLHRLKIEVLPEYKLLYLTVQLFAYAGMPSYIVLLGTLRDNDPLNAAG